MASSTYFGRVTISFELRPILWPIQLPINNNPIADVAIMAV
jgi:hypothetical protein